MQFGVADRIEWICADYVDYAEAYVKRQKQKAKDDAESMEEVDVVFLSPPWGKSASRLSSF